MATDAALEEVLAFLLRFPNVESVIANAIRQAIDEVIEGPRTGRWSISELSKVEKTYIGTRVEIVVRSELGLENGKLLDYIIMGHEVDAKYTIKAYDWMIPHEAVNQLCLLMSANDEDHEYNVGIVRAVESILRGGTNQDKKTSISASGRASIRWIVHKGVFPKNFLMHDLSPTERSAVFSEHAGQARVNALFRQAARKPIPAAAIVAVAAELEDAHVRAAAAARELSEQYDVLDGDDPSAQAKARKLGVIVPAGYFMSVKKK